MKKHYVIFYSTFFLSITITAQYIQRSTISMGGSSRLLKKNKLLIQQSIGQASVIGSFKKNGISIRQGFLQMLTTDIKPSKSKLFINNLKATVFPNPIVNGELTILFDEEITSKISVFVFDLLGRKLITKNHKPSTTVTIDLSELASAYYMLSIHSGNKRFTTNIIKEK